MAAELRPGWRPGHDSLRLSVRRSRWGLRRFLENGGLPAPHHLFRGPRRPAPASRFCGAAPHGGRLRFSAPRARLEDRRARAAAAVMGPGFRRRQPSWRNYTTTSPPGQELILRAHMLSQPPRSPLQRAPPGRCTRSASRKEDPVRLVFKPPTPGPRRPPRSRTGAISSGSSRTSRQTVAPPPAPCPTPVGTPSWTAPSPPPQPPG